MNAPRRKQPPRPAFQFSLMGMMVVMFVVAAAAAPGYYMLHSREGLPQGRLVGMLMVLAGPLLLMTILSLLLAALGRGDREE
jgi:hypothetical protein